MKILYHANRINSPDGSSVHCRAFVRSAQELGADVRTFPPMKTLPTIKTRKTQGKKDLIYYLKKVNLNTVKHYLHRSNPYVSEIISYLEGWEYTTKDYYALREVVSKFCPEVIVFRYRPFDLSPFWIAKKLGIPVVTEINSLKSMEASLQARKTKATALTRWGERNTISSADAIFTVSQAIKAKIESYAIKQKRVISVIPNGVDTEVFKPDDGVREMIRSQLGLSGKRVLGYVGSYKNWHDLDTSVEVIERLAKENTNFHLLLIGDGQQYGVIRNKIQTKNLEKYITQTGSVPHENIPKYLAAFDYALMTYPKLDNFYFSPLKMFEYMAMGIQVVSTDIGQISEIITHGKTGWLVNSPSAKQFCEVILAAEKGSHDVGKNSRKLMQEEYGWRNNAEKILQLAASVV